MKNEDVATIIKYRLDQAQEALDVAARKYLLDGKRSPQSLRRTGPITPMLMPPLPFYRKAKGAVTKHTGVISLFDTSLRSRGFSQKNCPKIFHKAFELR